MARSTRKRPRMTAATTALLAFSAWAASISVAEANSESVILEAHLSQHDVRGTVTFTQPSAGAPVSIAANLSVSREYKGEYSWGIYEFPIGNNKRKQI